MVQSLIMKVDWEKEKDKLKSLIDSKIPYSKIGKIYDVSGAAVKKAAKKLKIPLPLRRKKNPSETFNKGKTLKLKTNCYCLNCNAEININRKFCSNKCQSQYERKQFIAEWKSGAISGISGKYNISKRLRNYLIEKANYRCEICGWGEVNKYSNTLPLEVHHKDGNFRNNSEENLQVLCPNCHSLTETYKNHNKNGRKDRKIYT